MTVAGNSNTFTVAAGGSAEMIAGQNIIYLPGSTVQPGGYMHGYISMTFCGQKSSTIVTNPTGDDAIPSAETFFFTLYPNPTSGNFFVAPKGERTGENVNVEVYTMQGDKVLTGTMTGENRLEFRSAGLASGIYFVRIIAGDYVETIKLVKTR
jgi:hypothetical protein